MSAGARRRWQMAVRACAVPIPRNRLHARGDEVFVVASVSSSHPRPRLTLATPATAFLVSPRHVMTAAHALPEQGVPDLVYAFGYGAASVHAASADAPARVVFPAEAIFGLRSVAWRILSVLEGDAALIELDREVPAALAQPLVIASREPVLGEAIALLGFPEGGALAHAEGQMLGYDETWLDHDVEAGPGWSGAPVLDARGEVLAVHTGTAVDGPLAMSTFTGAMRRMRAGRFVALASAASRSGHQVGEVSFRRQ